MNQRAIPAVWMRGGTSKGLFFKASDLPKDVHGRDLLLMRAIGSPDVFGKQIDGLGGATSSTSKIVILSPSPRAGFDVDYLFGHVPVNGMAIDYSGNCGNLTAAVGVFAVEAGWLRPDAGCDQIKVRIWQQNIQRAIDVMVPLTADGRVEVGGDYWMDGVPFSGARLAVTFHDPAGPRLFPTGKLVDQLNVPGLPTLDATLMDAGNPAVFVRAKDLGLAATETPAELDATPGLLGKVEALRRQATVQMGLATTLEEAAQRPATPKLALVAEPQDYVATAGRQVRATELSLCARIFSMGKAHHAFTGTGAVGLAVAAAIPGTLVADACAGKGGSTVWIGHAAGRMDVVADVMLEKDVWHARGVTLGRTARSLMRGEVLVPL